ncbi:hypothetical protein CHX27_13990 [Flavobacterium aurantiibacter]|uniref:Uncharacterized protein n=1 Tax=Flavobacterium aurantiibacter TaxID=2023067 RepID=A0A255ZFE4_9FLAO|nr:hypothetical protein CHX27_13990 [Flavobacterium aurantiibacter]
MQRYEYGRKNNTFTKRTIFGNDFRSPDCNGNTAAAVACAGVFAAATNGSCCKDSRNRQR